MPRTDWTINELLIVALILLEGVVGIALLAWLFTTLVLRAALRPPGMALIVILAVVAVTCIVGYIVMGNTRQELVAIGSACVGALTATLTQLHAAHVSDSEEDDEIEETEEEL